MPCAYNYETELCCDIINTHLLFDIDIFEDIENATRDITLATSRKVIRGFVSDCESDNRDFEVVCDADPRDFVN